jgi:hypothetical protein
MNTPIQSLCAFLESGKLKDFIHERIIFNKMISLFLNVEYYRLINIGKERLFDHESIC